MNNIRFFIILSLISLRLVAQTGAEQCAKGKRLSFEKYAKKLASTAESDTTIDVTYYQLALSIDPTKKYLTAATTIVFLPKKTISSCFFALTNSLTVDSVLVGTTKIPFQHQNDKVALTLDKSYTPNTKVRLTVYYQGNPPKNQNESFNFTTHGTASTPVVWSLSEPFGASDWWVCKNDLTDKADSSDVAITMPAGYVSVSNGILEKKETHNNLATYYWKSRYPIADYLISIACSNYTEYTNYYAYNQDDSLTISHFIYPERLTQSLKKTLDETVPIMAKLSEKLGEYPFIKEKYGHVNFGYGGGMEHQTCSSMGAFDADIITHELTHQWFGDKVTCKTWEDIWVNEGFATYSELLYAETKGNYDDYLAYYMEQAKLAKGKIAVENTASINEIFDYQRTYCKGAVVLHSLRSLVGDDALFFKILQTYLSKFAYKTASIRDFQQVAEQVYGQSLSNFFNEWLYGSGYPTLEYGWKMTDNQQVTLLIKQQNATGSTVFHLPLEIKVNYTNRTSSVHTVSVSQLSEVFTITPTTNAIANIELDPRNVFLKEVRLIDFSVLANETSLSEFAVYPVPATDFITIQYPQNQNFTVSIVDILGREMAIGQLAQNQYSIQELPSGNYWLVLKNEEKIYTKRFIKK